MCDMDVIRNHVIDSHKMGLGQYKKDYVMKGGGKVFPTFCDYLKDNDVFESLKMDKARVERNQEDSDKIMPWMLSSESEDSDEA